MAAHTYAMAGWRLLPVVSTGVSRHWQVTRRVLSDPSDHHRDPFYDEIRAIRTRAFVVLPGVCLVLVFQVLAMITGSLRQLTTLPSDALNISCLCLGFSLIALVVVASGNVTPQRAAFGDAFVRSVLILTAGMIALALGLAATIFVAVAHETGSASWGAVAALVLLGVCSRLWI